MVQRDFDVPDDDMFRLWRAVFALVHADGKFSDDEKKYIEHVTDQFSFSSKQKSIIQKDIKQKADVVALFNDIEKLDNGRQFFLMARTIVWCDGFLHELEMDAIQRVVKSLGNDANMFEAELRWIERKPVRRVGQDEDAHHEGVIKIVVEQMSAFYKEKVI